LRGSAFKSIFETSKPNGKPKLSRSAGWASARAVSGDAARTAVIPAAPSTSPAAIATDKVRMTTGMTFISLLAFLLLISKDVGWVSRP